MTAPQIFATHADHAGTGEECSDLTCYQRYCELTRPDGPVDDFEVWAQGIEQMWREWPRIDHAQRTAYGQDHKGCAGCTNRPTI